MRKLMGPEMPDDKTLEIGYAEDGILWITASPKVPDASAAEAYMAEWNGRWRVVEGVFLAPEFEKDGRPVFAEYEEHSWSEAESDAPYARRGWRLVDVTMPDIVIDGDEQPNPLWGA